MMTDPPCIDPLLGCSGTFFGGSGGSSSSGGGFSGQYNSFSSSSRSSLSFSSRSSSSSSSFDLSRYLGSGSTIARSAKEYFAMYTLKARNTTSSALKAVKVVHGPFPFSLTFDPTRSARQCYQNQNTIECMTDLGPGESKDFTIAYKTNSSFSCGLARFLQTAKAAVQSISGSGSNPVVVSVSCSVKAESQQSSSGSRSGASSSFSPGASSYGSGITVMQPSTGGYKPVQGYKPYAVMPRTGAGDFFAAATSTDFLSAPNGLKDVSNGSVFLFPILLLSVLSVAVLAKVTKVSFFR